MIWILCRNFECLKKLVTHDEQDCGYCSPQCKLWCEAEREVHDAMAKVEMNQ